MTRFLSLFFFLSFLFQGCDDGEIIITSFNFDSAELKSCGQLGNFVFYKVNPEALESLSLKLGVLDSLYKTAGTKLYALNGTTNFVNYRTYDGTLGANYFCSDIPPSSPHVTTEFLAVSGTVEITTIFKYNDDDGVPTADEFDGDTDGDGIPDLYDEDDDGDNVPTAFELDTFNADGDNNPLTNFLDTDGDGIPDYLDPDDDDDEVPTRYEDENMDLDPRNDVTDPDVGADYLNPAVADTYVVDQYRLHTYQIVKSATIVLKNLVLKNGDEEMIIETINMGTLENLETVQKSTTPMF